MSSVRHSVKMGVKLLTWQYAVLQNTPYIVFSSHIFVLLKKFVQAFYQTGDGRTPEQGCERAHGQQEHARIVLGHELLRPGRRRSTASSRCGGRRGGSTRGSGRNTATRRRPRRREDLAAVAATGRFRMRWTCSATRHAIGGAVDQMVTGCGGGTHQSRAPRWCMSTRRHRGRRRGPRGPRGPATHRGGGRLVGGGSEGRSSMDRRRRPAVGGGEDGVDSGGYSHSSKRGSMRRQRTSRRSFCARRLGPRRSETVASMAAGVRGVGDVSSPQTIPASEIATRRKRTMRRSYWTCFPLLHVLDGRRTSSSRAAAERCRARTPHAAAALDRAARRLDPCVRPANPARHGPALAPLLRRACLTPLLTE